MFTLNKEKFFSIKIYDEHKRVYSVERCLDKSQLDDLIYRTKSFHPNYTYIVKRRKNVKLVEMPIDKAIVHIINKLF